MLSIHVEDNSSSSPNKKHKSSNSNEPYKGRKLSPKYILGFTYKALTLDFPVAFLVGFVTLQLIFMFVYIIYLYCSSLPFPRRCSSPECPASSIPLNLCAGAVILVLMMMAPFIHVSEKEFYLRY